MRYLAGIAVLLTLTAAELSPAPRPRARRERPPRCVALRVEAADSAGRRGRTFSAEEVADLRFEVWLHERFASEPITVKLFTPRDKLYQVLDLGADADSSPSGGLRDRLAARFHLQTLVGRLPVAGTHVTTYAMYGEWRAEAYIGDAESPCARPLEFVIEP